MPKRTGLGGATRVLPSDPSGDSNRKSVCFKNLAEHLDAAILVRHDTQSKKLD